MMKKLLLTLLLLVLPAQSWAQITIPNTFTPFSIITAAAFNTNFSELGTKSLNRTGGTLTGNLVVDVGILIDGADVSTYLLGGGKLAASSVAADALDVAGGITVGTGNVALVDTTGKIPSLSSTYFASLAATNLTSIPAGQLTGTIAAIDGAAITNLSPANLSGIIPTSKLGTGTANSTTFLRGDQVWATTGVAAEVPTGAIFFFNGACASGYTEFTNARGRYIVGLTLSGTLNTGVGTALSNQEDRVHTHLGPDHSHSSAGLGITGTSGSEPSHTHSFSSGGPSSTAAIIEGGGNPFTVASQSHTHGGVTGSAGIHDHGVGTYDVNGSTSLAGNGATGSNSVSPSPYIQLRVCQKD